MENDKVITIKPKNIKKRVTIISLIVAIVILFSIFSLMLYNKTTAYNKGMAFIEDVQYDKAIEIFSTIDGFKDSQQQIETLQNYILLNDTISEDLYSSNYSKVLETVKSMDLESLNYCKNTIVNRLNENLLYFNVESVSLNDIDYDKLEEIKSILEIVDISDTNKGENVIKYTDSVLKLEQYIDVILFCDMLDDPAFDTISLYTESVLKNMSSDNWGFYDSIYGRLSQSALKEIEFAISSLEPVKTIDCQKYILSVKNLHTHLLEMHNSILLKNKDRLATAIKKVKAEITIGENFMNKYLKLYDEADMILKEIPNLKS